MMRLARALVYDGIDESAIDEAKAEVCALLHAMLEDKREDQGFKDQVDGKALISYGARDLRPDEKGIRQHDLPRGRDLAREHQRPLRTRRDARSVKASIATSGSGPSREPTT